MARVVRTSIYTCCLVVASALFSAHAAPPSTHIDLAALDKAALQRDLANLGAPITSQRSLSRHLSAGVTESPLGRLSQPALRRFLASLQFNESGLTTFRYTELEAELTPTQIYQVLALFGQQHQTPKLKHARRVTPRDDEIMGGGIPGVQPANFECYFDQVSPIDSPSQCGGHHNYRCASPGTCSPSQEQICTNNC